ncbi:MAG: cell division ATP-binding protein FtsE [Alphaproteobacteria bacterium]|nr:cell division ATP-binding protein FtsE [Alphaproteobacteria bacterium]
MLRLSFIEFVVNSFQHQIDSTADIRAPGPGGPGNCRSSRLIQFENVGLRYGAGQETLSDITFSITPGSFQFLTGPSGAGKTSLLRLILLALKPTRGVIRIFGEPSYALSSRALTDYRRHAGVVFQDFRLLDHLTVFENISLPLIVQGREQIGFRTEVSELLDWVGLGEKAGAFPPTLSGGEKQRVAIARALISRPQILLADEPTGNVDPAMARRLLRLFVELNKSGTSVVLATHDLGLMDQFEYARRLVLGEGRMHIYE